MSRQPTGLASLVSFPNPVNEVVARTVATGVVVLGLATVVLGLPWLTAVLAVGFGLRVLAGPKLSPLAILATRVIVPRLPFRAKLVPGPPKRFAQTIGLVFSSSAGLLFLLGLDTAGSVVIAALVVAASLEAFAGLCLGCQAFALLIRLGVIPQEVCEACNDIWARRASAAP